VNKRGSITETTSVTILLFLLGVSTYALIAAGYGSFNRMNKLRDESLNTRVAINYISMQIRRSGTAGSVRVDDTPRGTCLVLSENINGENYETRIYLYNGYLQESFVPAGTPFNEKYGFEIIQLDSFNIKLDNNVITIELSGGANRRSMKLTLMAA